jgi:hypothetical protein
MSNTFIVYIIFFLFKNNEFNQIIRHFTAIRRQTSDRTYEAERTKKTGPLPTPPF